MRDNITLTAEDRGTIDPLLTYPDLLVLEDLLHDIKDVREQSGRLPPKPADNNQPTIDLLMDLNDPASDRFETTVFTAWDDQHIHSRVNKGIIQPYVQWARGVVRIPTDVVFLTHILLYFGTSVPSALILFYHFTWMHAICHLAMQVFYSGPFTLMMHNHIHNRGILNHSYAWIDMIFPYVLEPLHGHTWDSYYYHHVKHHHIEGNGPDDLSSTIRYQRDNIFHFLHYFGRFLFFTWAELPLYFIRKGRIALAVKFLISELGSYLFIYLMAQWNLRATVFVLMLPLFVMRLGMMIGNWGQHALVDEIEPTSDYRSSITLIDVASNRLCFNDGYHTSHHLNPLRHWRVHPVAFLKGKSEYSEGRALVFRNIDYLMLSYRLFTRNYLALAKCLVPIGDQIGLTQLELADLLRSKTRMFTEDDIRKKFRKS